MAPQAERGARVVNDEQADKLYQWYCDFLSLEGQSALSRQFIENKGSKKRFFSSQSRYHTQKKSTYSQPPEKLKMGCKLFETNDDNLSLAETEKAGQSEKFGLDTR